MGQATICSKQYEDQEPVNITINQQNSQNLDIKLDKSKRIIIQNQINQKKLEKSISKSQKIQQTNQINQKKIFNSEGKSVNVGEFNSGNSTIDFEMGNRQGSVQVVQSFKHPKKDQSLSNKIQSNSLHFRNQKCSRNISSNLIEKLKKHSYSLNTLSKKDSISDSQDQSESEDLIKIESADRVNIEQICKGELFNAEKIIVNQQTQNSDVVIQCLI